MKALTLTQPWASLVALGLKRIETRSWRTRHRGPLAIHAAKGFPASARRFADEERFRGRLPEDLPHGAILCTVELVGCHPTDLVAPGLVGLERLYGDYAPGRWAWLFKPGSLRVLDTPVPARGALGLWEFDELAALTGNVNG
jgi:hypothetical protein